MQVLVEPEGELAGPPRFRMQGHLIHAVSDPHNFAVADCDSLFASICVSAKTAADHSGCAGSIRRVMGYMLLTQRYLTGDSRGLRRAERHRHPALRRFQRGQKHAGFRLRAGRLHLCLRTIAPGCSPAVRTGSRSAVRTRSASARMRPRHFPELEGWIARARPNGKISIEVPTRTFPGSPPRSRCEIGRIVFLHRDSGRDARWSYAVPVRK